MPPMKVLQAATSWNAKHFHINDIGSIEVGKLADMDIVNADPLQDIKNLRNLDTVIKDGKVVDRSYHPWFKGDMFADSHESYDRDVVDISWEVGLKAATAQRGRGAAAEAPAAAPVAGAAPAPGPANGRRGGGLGAIPDPQLSPSPGIETIFPHTIVQGTADTTFTLTGINFVKKSTVYVDGQAMPTNVTGRTQLSFVVDANTLNKAGKLRIRVKNPEPLLTPDWGPISNTAYVLVPFAFTTHWSQNKDIGDFQK